MPNLTIETMIADGLVIDATITEGLRIEGTINTVGGDPAGTAAALITDHENAVDPHPDYLTMAEAEAQFGAGSVASVNGEEGPDVVLVATDVNAVPTDTTAPVLRASVGTESLDTVLQADLTAAHGNDVGLVEIPPGKFTLSDDLTLQDGVRLVNHGEVTYTGTGLMCLLDNTDGTGITPGPIVEGGRWIGTANAIGAFRILDASACRIRDMKIEGFGGTGGDTGANARGFAVELRNEAQWCETNWLQDLRIAGCRHGIVFTPQSISGGVGGTDSFARTKIINMQVSGGSALWPLGVWLRGNVYDSVIYTIGGNVSAGLVPYLGFGAGGMNGTTILDLGIEGTAGSGLFGLDGAGPSQWPILLGTAHRDADQVDWVATAGEFGGQVLHGARQFQERAAAPLNPPTGRVSVYAIAERLGARAATGPARTIAWLSEVTDHTNDTTAHGAADIVFTPTGELQVDDAEAAIIELAGLLVAHVEYDDIGAVWPARPANRALVIWSAADPGTAGTPAEFVAGDLLVTSF